MYQIVGLINKFMFGPSQDTAEAMSNLYNQRQYTDDHEDDRLTDTRTGIRQRRLGNNQSSVHDAHGGPAPAKQSQSAILRDEEGEEEEEEQDYIPTNLKLVILISGKRKSGKDHISTLITNHIGHHRVHHMALLRIAGPIKREFARNNNLDFTRLLDSSSYKENFRMAMVEWSESYRERQGWNYFLKLAIKEQRARDKAVWILNDARRTCDLDYFDEDPAFQDTRVIKLRIEASEAARISRGWKFVSGIDDRPTECGLDDYDNWTYVVNNNYNDRREEVMKQLRPIFEEIDAALDELTQE